MKSQADKHRQDCYFTVGDWVLLRLHPYRQHSVHRRTSAKLSRRYYGLFHILRRVGLVAYKLDLPAGAPIHPVFHISLLKPFHGDPPTSYGSLPTDVSGSSDPRQPLRILRNEADQHLVQWDDDDDTSTSWVSLADFTSQFPHFSLEVKAGLDDPSNNTGRTNEIWAIRGSLGREESLGQEQTMD
ncbi:UNVERIFIED_CONTAM: hypothetical protein Sradi_6831000 [Sesamum radiatum]|uniref:Tf2-1-like SH3-like domain-containing protein n=1 Tax=Sesamum radiatum TaxID=300843 RepID=A0AAW2JUD2_SESRA